ncbi:UBP-type zinc finger domain-containing protein [Blastococcus sp. SYSU DS0828]
MTERCSSAADHRARRSPSPCRSTGGCHDPQDRRERGGRMSGTGGGCPHLDDIDLGVTPSAPGCEDCLRSGGRWVHLRMCASCGHIGCCDSSPNRHATAHADGTGHPLVRSFEPGEEWFWCYPDRIAFELRGAPPAPSHP